MQTIRGVGGRAKRRLGEGTQERSYKTKPSNSLSLPFLSSPAAGPNTGLMTDLPPGPAEGTSSWSLAPDPLRKIEGFEGDSR